MGDGLIYTTGTTKAMRTPEKGISAAISLLLGCVGKISGKWRIRLSNVIGRIWFACDKTHRRIVLKNLHLAFSGEKTDREISQLAIHIFQNISRIIFEIGWSMELRQEDFSRYFSIKGLSNLQRAYQKKKGVLLLTGHFGNWELLAVIAAMIESPVHVLYRPLDIEPIDVWLHKYRSRYGSTMIPNTRSMRKIFRVLKNGGIVSLLMDQNVDWYEGVFVDFFGQRACTNSGMALLALKTEAAVVPVFLARQGFGFVVEFGEELPFVRTGDKRQDIETNTQKYNYVLESIIRRYPEQWFWVHQRWKTKPYQPWPRVQH